jgi:hypothetical protein
VAWTSNRYNVMQDTGASSNALLRVVLGSASTADTEVEIMLRFALAFAVFAAITSLQPGPGHAQTSGNAPWCAVVNRGAGEIVHECYYQSAAECAPNVVAGNRGFCSPNPYWTPPPGSSQAARAKH